MKISKKILTLILVISIFSALFAACGGETADPGDAETPDTNGSSQAENGEEPGASPDSAEAELRETVLGLYSYPDEDFNGYEFKVMIRGQQDEWDNRDLVAEEESGEAGNDAVFRRNVELEEALGVTITGIWVTVGDQPGALRRAVSAGDNAYDMVMMNFESLSSASQQGQLVNLDNLAGINLDFPWWDQNLLHETSMGSRNFFATGDITTMTNDGTWTMMFNKQLARDYDIPDLYEIVKAGEWTVDKMLELGKPLSVDLNGDGEMDHTDQYAFTTTLDSVQGLFYSTGNRITTKDASDLPVLALFGDNLMRNLDKIYEIMRGAEDFTLLTADWSRINPLTHLIAQAAFEENRALFLAEVMQLVIRLRQMETDFGVIPMPKASAEQPNYLTNIHQWASSAVAIPQGTLDEERSALIIEALAYGGFKYIRPAYYDIALQTMHARDEESAAMLDIILAGRVADYGRINDFGGVMGTINNNVNNRNNAFASALDRLAERLDRDIERAIERLEGLE
ncbi:MAG: extracellular solute-binding protein [Oscillospiraceae bacterium]|nr:extracellular solute-binding protein [Oscillospiraceae bacterium]